MPLGVPAGWPAATVPEDLSANRCGEGWALPASVLAPILRGDFDTLPLPEVVSVLGCSLDCVSSAPASCAVRVSDGDVAFLR